MTTLVFNPLTTFKMKKYRGMAGQVGCQLNVPLKRDSRAEAARNRHGIPGIRGGEWRPQAAQMSRADLLLKIQSVGTILANARLSSSFNWEQTMKKAFGCAAIAITLLAITAPAEAKGCIKGALVGGVAGHFAGHHGVLGAAAGCAIGHHEANKQQKTQPRTTGSASPTAPR